MSYPSAFDGDFLRTVRDYLGRNGEVLLLIRYSYAAGRRDFELHSSFEDLTERLAKLAPRTSVIAFKQAQLPLRGVVDNDFINLCLDRIPEGSVFLILQTTRIIAGPCSWFHHADGTSHQELKAELDDLRGEVVAAGIHPPWNEDTDDLIAAVIPDKDGVPRTGIY